MPSVEGKLTQGNLPSVESKIHSTESVIYPLIIYGVFYSAEAKLPSVNLPSTKGKITSTGGKLSEGNLASDNLSIIF